MSFTTNGINYNIPDNSAYYSQIANNQDYSVNFNITLRSCISGEEYEQSGKCKTCDAGTYLLTAPSPNELCKTCKSEAVCLGGNQIYPLRGYWRGSTTSDDFLTCRNDVACL